MSLDEFATLLYNTCIIGTEILFFSVPFGLGLAWVIQARAAAPTRRNGIKPTLSHSLRTFVGVALALLSSVRDRIYARRCDPKGQQFEIVQSPETIKSAIVWIHGTWRDPSAVVHNDLLEGLKREFPTALILAFNWNSRNLQHDRKVASDLLRQELARIEYSDIPISLVGHSHGGSVAASVTSSLAESRNIKAITLATPFVSVDVSGPWVGGSQRSIQSALSSMVPFQLWSVFAGLVAGSLLWNSGLHLLPPVDGLFGLEASDVLASMLVASLVGLSGAYVRNFSLAERIWAVRRNLDELGGVNAGTSELTPLRADDDPLLNTLASVIEAHDRRTAISAFLRRKVNAMYGTHSVAVCDFIFKIAALVVVIYITEPVYLTLAKASLRFPSESWTRYALVGIVATILTLVAFALWNRPVRVFVSLGVYVASFLLAIAPPNLLLTIAQARAAGLPIDVLLSGAIRINDAPNGLSPVLIQTNGALQGVSVLRRHTEMLRLPEVINRVVEAIRMSNET